MQQSPSQVRDVRVVAGTGYTLTALALLVAAMPGKDQAADGPKAPSSKPFAPTLFQGWPEKTPEVVLVLSGEQHSYIKFCGCSQPQLGGFERRYNFIAKLKEKGWPVVPLDLGDLVFPRTGTIQSQTLLKYVTSMKEMNLLGYPAIGVGQHEFNLPLLSAVSGYTLQNPTAKPQLLAANLNEGFRIEQFPKDEKTSMIGDALVANGGALKVGVTAVVAPSVRDQIHDKTMKFDDNKSVLPKIAENFTKANANLRVLLYQGLPKEAEAVVKANPTFNVVLSKSVEEEPPAQPMTVGKTMIVSVGHRGRYVGVVGVFRNGEGLDLRYQLVAMGEEYETDPDKIKDHPAIQLLEEYARQVRDQNLLLHYPKVQHPLQVKHKGQRVGFVGSEACKTCHAADYQKWALTKHAHAFEALVNQAAKPSLRQFDGECIVCHTIGFAHENGYVSEQRTPHLKNVGCENCHGPGELHVNNPNHLQWRAELSPWKSAPSDRLVGSDGKYNPAILNAVDGRCQKCHDFDNDPNYRFEKNWPQIEHGKKLAAAAGR